MSKMSEIDLMNKENVVKKDEINAIIYQAINCTPHQDYEVCAKCGENVCFSQWDYFLECDNCMWKLKKESGFIIITENDNFLII